MDWFLCDNGLRHERVNGWFYSVCTDIVVVCLHAVLKILIGDVKR